MSTLTVRAKLLIGFLINMILLAVVFLYGYLALQSVIQSNDIIQYSTQALRSSDLIAKSLLQTKVDEQSFLSTNDVQYAENIYEHLKDLETETIKLVIQHRDYGSPNIPIATEAMINGIHSYENSFSRLDFLIQQRGNSRNDGFKGTLERLRIKIKPRVSELFYLKIKALEYQYLDQYLDRKSVSFSHRMNKLMAGELKKGTSKEAAELLFEYENEFKTLVYLDEEIRDQVYLLSGSFELIEIFLDDRINMSASIQNEQSQSFDQLINKRFSTLLLIGLGSVVIAWIVIFMFGMEPLSLAKLLQEQNAILEAINDGIIAVDKKGRVKVVNQSARDVLSSEKDLIGMHITDVIPGTRLPEVMNRGVAEYDHVLKINNTSIIATRVPVKYRNRIIGGVSSFRKKEDVSRLAKELTQIRQYSEALRANKHEYNNRLQTIYGMIQLKHFDEVLKYIDQLQSAPEQKVSMFVDQIQETGISAILLGKYNEAKEKGVAFTLDEHSALEPLPESISAHSLITIIGNLVQNAIEAVLVNQAGDRNVTFFITESQFEIFIKVTDNGPGVPKEVASKIFEKGFSTKSELVRYKAQKTTDHENMGMGLYIVSNEVTQLNGKLQYRIKEKTVFEIVIPKKSI